MVQTFVVLTSHVCIASPNLVYGYMWRAANTHIYDVIYDSRVSPEWIRCDTALAPKRIPICDSYPRTTANIHLY